MNNYPLFFKPSGFVAVERCRPKLPLEPKKPTLKLVKKNWFEDLILCFDGLDDERINAKRVEKYNRQMEVYKKELAAYKKQIKHILSSTEMCNFRRKEKERLLKQTRLGQLLSHDVKKGKFEKTFKDLLDNKWGRFISDELEFPLPNGRAYVPDFAYVDAETGEIGITEDFNNATYQFTGKKYMAPLTGGFGINVGWRGISLSADFSWNARKYLLNNALIYLENPNYGAVFNRSKRLLNAWKQPGDITDVPKYGYQTYLDSSILEDASFLRLKNLTLSYDFPSELIRKSGFIEGFKVYFISRNLFTVTQFSGYDPEVDSNKSLGEYPNSREFMFGVQFTF